MTDRPPEDPGIDPIGTGPGRRPMVERLGLASVALVVVLMFGAIAAVSWAGGEVFLAAMAGAGAVMTLWAGVITTVRG